MTTFQCLYFDQICLPEQLQKKVPKMPLKMVHPYRQSFLTVLLKSQFHRVIATVQFQRILLLRVACHFCCKEFRILVKVNILALQSTARKD